MAWHAYRADMCMKTIDTGEHVRSHCSYLVNTVELCFYNTLDFFVFLEHAKFLCFLNTVEFLTH